MIPEKYFTGKKNLFHRLAYVWHKYCRSRFFTKMFLVYLIILVFSCLMLLYTLTQNLIAIQSDQSLLISDQILTSIDAYLKEKTANAYAVHQRLYQDPEVWHTVTVSFSGQGKMPAVSTIPQRQELDRKVAQALYSIDKDMRGIYFYSYEKKEAFQLGISPSAPDYAFFRACCPDLEPLSQSSPRLLSSREHTNPNNNAFSLFLLNTVTDPADFSRQTGILAVYFNAMNISQSYRQYEPYRKGAIYIFDACGQLLFDSEGSYELPEKFPFDRCFSTLAPHSFRQKETIYNVLSASDGQYRIVNAYTMSEILEDVGILKQSIFRAITLIFAFTLLTHLISTRFFAKRIRPITAAMEQIRQGHLTDFPIQKRYDDEIGKIYAELIQMCVSLDDHIKREYVYQLRQKEMELYALQAQINPHFLYNTLEAIRMNLYLKGDEETSRMIYILSDLFRSSMKTDLAVSIRQEINYARSYLELYQYRLGNRLRCEIEIPEEVYRYACLRHILQPLLENALVHGVRQDLSRQDCWTVRLGASIHAGDITFTIEDDGCGIGEERLAELSRKLNSSESFQDSIGIANVNSRLRIVYGIGYGIRMESREGVGTKVTLRMKAMRKKELETYVQNYDRR